MWKIRSWSDVERRGTVQGPHLGPYEFGASETAVFDYRIGEEVDVALDQSAAGNCVTRVSPRAARQPPSTHAAIFDEINALGCWDFQVHAYVDGVLTILASTDFCYYHLAEIRFHGVSFVSIATGFSHAIFRLASADEIDALRRATDVEGQTFCIVTEHGAGPDGPKHFVVAERVECKVETVSYRKRAESEGGARTE